jgi:hypothetical protein
MELRIVDVKSGGDAKQEAIWLLVLEDCELSDHLIADTTFDAEGVSNLNRHTYWFPQREAKKGDAVVVYTRRGRNAQDQTTTGKPLHRFFWNLDQAVWNDGGDGAVLVRIAGVSTHRVPPAGASG